MASAVQTLQTYMDKTLHKTDDSDVAMAHEIWKALLKSQECNAMTSSEYLNQIEPLRRYAVRTFAKRKAYSLCMNAQGGGGSDKDVYRRLKAAYEGVRSELKNADNAQKKAYTSINKGLSDYVFESTDLTTFCRRVHKFQETENIYEELLEVKQLLATAISLVEENCDVK